MVDYFSKNIEMNEYNFYKILKDKNITPKIISISKDILNIELYECTLEELLQLDFNNNELETIYKRVKDLIQKLHDNGIFHYDLHSSNIVCNTDFNDFRIIDFEDATFINIIDNEFIEDYNGMFECDCSNINELLDHELHYSWRDR